MTLSRPANQMTPWAPGRPTSQQWQATGSDLSVRELLRGHNAAGAWKNCRRPMGGAAVAHSDSTQAPHRAQLMSRVFNMIPRPLLTAHAISGLSCSTLTTSASICLRTRGDKGRTAELKCLRCVTQQKTREDVPEVSHGMALLGFVRYKLSSRHCSRSSPVSRVYLRGTCRSSSISGSVPQSFLAKI
jgi:hypothetical protein